MNIKIYMACLLVLVFALVGFFVSVPTKNDGIIISEVVACNDSVIYDNAGSYHDYIELYNPQAYPVDISGWHLSDSKQDLYKFTFPENTIIMPDSYWLVWAAENPQLSFRKDEHLYTGFAIKNGETIYFSTNKNNIADYVKIPAYMKCDKSYARVDNMHKWAVNKPTPEKENVLYNQEEKEVIDAVSVKFSKASGLYSEPFMLEMKAPEGFDIYYTLDGLTPNDTSEKYSAPIEIKDASDNPNVYSAIEDISYSRRYVPSFNVKKGTVVRAVAVRRSDGAVSKVKNASYFIGFENKKGYKELPIVSVITDPDNLFGREQGIYVLGKVWEMNGRPLNFPETWPRSYSSNFMVKGMHFARDVYVELISPKKLKTMEGQIKIHGSSSRPHRQKSFALLNLKTENGAKTMPDIQLRSFSCMEKILEPLIYEATKDRHMIVRNPEFVNLFLDGDYWGVYGAYEMVTTDFIVKNAGLKDKDKVDLAVNERYYGSADLYFFNTKSYEELSKEIDTASLIDFVVVNTYVSNADTCNIYTWNLARWRSSETPETNKWHWLLYDVDRFDFGQKLQIFEKHPQCSLVKNLSEFWTLPEFQKQFIISLEDIGNYNFNPKKINELLDKFKTEFGDSFVEHYRRFRDEYFLMPEDFSAKDLSDWIEKIQEFYDTRFDKLMPEIKEYFKLSGDLTVVEKKPSKIKGGIVLFNTLKLKADEPYRGRYYSDYDITLDVQTFDGYKFEGWLIDGELITTQKLNLKLPYERTIEAVFLKVDEDKK